MKLPIIVKKNEALNGSGKLYWTGSAMQSNESLLIKKGQKVCFNSYFNSLPIQKIQKYTAISKWKLELDVIGSCLIRLFSFTKLGTNVKIFEGTTEELDAFNFKNSNEYYSIGFEIEALSDAQFNSGQWNSIDGTLFQNNKTAIIICTHNRHEYLNNNIATLINNLPSDWKVFIVDNDSHPKVDSPGDSRFTVIRNPNTGGAGGFTRGLIEVINSPRNFTHALLMDDDILLEPGVLHKTKEILSYIKPEFSEYFLSGAMLKMDEPVIQYESGAYWDGWRVCHLENNVDISEPRIMCDENKQDKRYSTYAAWWYCAIPLSKSMLEDLPMPSFIMGDDIEYSLRRAKGIMRLDGISVWHESFVGKQNPVKLFYLSTRNGLLINILHSYSRWNNAFMVFVRFFLQWKRGNKLEQSLVVKGAEDFLMGPDFLKRAENPFKISDPPKKGFFACLKVICKLIFQHKKVKELYNVEFNEAYWKELFVNAAGNSNSEWEYLGIE